MQTKPTLLFVDDEKNILHQIRRELYDAPFNILLANSAQEGLLLLNKTAVDVVVSDVQMPDMDGIKFLEIVKREYPGTMRTVLSGHLDEGVVLSAITRGIASSFFAKPWNSEPFRLDFEHILETRQAVSDPSLLKILNSISTLPTLPEICTEFITALNEGQAIKELATILGRDVNLAANILHMANAAYFSTVRISSLERALLQLGSKIIRDTVLTLSLAQQFTKSAPQKAELHKLLSHASLVNRITTFFYHQIHYKNLDELINSAALTHEIGKILLLHCFPDTYWRVQKQMEQDKALSFREAEILVNGHEITHCELGAFFLSTWNFAGPNISAALYHHNPQMVKGTQAQLIQLIYLANIRANMPAEISEQAWLEATPKSSLSVYERRLLFANKRFDEPG